MVVIAGGKKSSLRAEALSKLKAEHSAVKVQRPFEIGYLQVHMSDTHAGVYGVIRHSRYCSV
jgi:hypothetical protein